MKNQNIKNMKFSMNKAVSARQFLKDWFEYVLKKETEKGEFKPVINKVGFLESYDNDEIYCQQLNSRGKDSNEILTICMDYKTISDGDIRLYYIIKNHLKNTEDGATHKLEIVPYMVYVYEDDSYEDPWGVIDRMERFYYN